MSTGETRVEEEKSECDDESVNQKKTPATVTRVEMLEMEQIFDTNEINEVPNTYEVPENSPQEPKEDNINIRGTVSAAVEKKWPGWPGESVFRFLIPTHKVGSIIGRKGEIIRKICEETRSRIKILDAPPGTAERAVMVSAKEEPDNSLPPAIDGLLRVHKRVLDGLEGDNGHDVPVMGGKVSTRLLAPAIQAGILIGKLGTTIKSIQEASNCNVRVLGTEAVPVFALEDDRIVEVVGEPAAILKAIELIASHLRKFLVDRSIISVIEMNMQMTNPAIEHMPLPQSWGPPAQAFPLNATGAGGPGYGPKPHFLPPPRQMNDYYPQPDIAPPREKLPHQGITAYGREAPVTAHKSSSTQSMPAVITQVTQKMQVPLTYADAVIGTAGSNISYIRRASGATVTIQETRGVPGEMTVEINGTASQVQTAQQLVQNFMAEAGAGSQTNTGGSIDQGYNSFAAPGSAYTPPLNTEYTGQIGNYGASQSGGYNSTQSGGYGADQTGSYNVSQTGDYSDFQPEGYSSGPSGGYGSVYGGNYGYQTSSTY